MLVLFYLLSKDINGQLTRKEQDSRRKASSKVLTSEKWF